MKVVVIWGSSVHCWNAAASTGRGTTETNYQLMQLPSSFNSDDEEENEDEEVVLEEVRRALEAHKTYSEGGTDTQFWSLFY